jgi:hypothetical protein
LDAKPLSIGRILGEKQRFVVPIYQRTYAWNVRDQLEPFFEQVEAKATERLNGSRSGYSHYMGALLVIPDSEAVFGRVQEYNVVDGQQRLTTFHLFYAALRDLALELSFDRMAQQLAELLLINDDALLRDQPEQRYKLQPTTYDRTLFRDLIELRRSEIVEKYSRYFWAKGTLRVGEAPLPLRAWSYFRDKASSFVQEGVEMGDYEKRLLTLSTALFEDFRLIVITLSADDDAQVIFRTLNSGGKPLAAMDLVRNDIFHRANRRKEDIESLVHGEWSTFEQEFWKQEQTQGRIRKPRIDFYLAHTLAAEQGQDISLTELYAEYKGFVSKRGFASAAAEIETLAKYTQVYRELVNPSESKNGALSRLANRLSVFDVSTAYPLVFAIATSKVDAEVKEVLYGLTASYIIRRALCYLTPKNYNKTFVRLVAALYAKGVSAQVLAEEFKSLEGDTVRFPSDIELRNAIQSNSYYGGMAQARLRLILEELELAQRDKFDEAIGLRSDLTIEHIMPGSWSEHWPFPDGRHAPADLDSYVDEKMRLEIIEREKVKHSLGNLTLLTPAANPSLGNRSFEEKKQRLRDSLLKMNQMIAAKQGWDGNAIAERSAQIGTIGHCYLARPDCR